MFPPAPYTHSADRHAKMLFTTHTLNLPTCKPRKLEPLAISGYGCPRNRPGRNPTALTGVFDLGRCEGDR